jgi:hypothetical protein
MRTLNYPHCVVCDDVVFLSESNLYCRPAFETYMENVTVNINDNGVIDICGDEVQYDIVFNKTKISDLNETPQENYINHYKGFKLFGFYLIKPYDYVKPGWYRLKERKTKRITINKYKLEVVN